MFAATANSPLDEEGIAAANLRQDTALELPSRPESRAYSLLPGNLEMPEAAIAPPTPTGPPPFEPLGEHDVYDVFDLELTLAAGGKVRSRSSHRPLLLFLFRCGMLIRTRIVNNVGSRH